MGFVAPYDEDVRARLIGIAESLGYNKHSVAGTGEGFRVPDDVADAYAESLAPKPAKPAAKTAHRDKEQ